MFFCCCIVFFKKKTNNDSECWWGGYMALDCFCRNWRWATSSRHEGQTGLISLQQPLKFLPWDINEVIHRKAAAHHTPPTTLFPPQQPTAASLPPCRSATLPRKGSAVPEKKPIQLPPESMTAPDRWPRSRRQMSRGVGCAAVRVSPCQERVTTVWLCVLHQQKNNVSTGVSTMVWGMVVLSPYFIYFCLPVGCLSLTVMSNYWRKAY